MITLSLKFGAPWSPPVTALDLPANFQKSARPITVFMLSSFILALTPSNASL